MGRVLCGQVILNQGHTHLEAQKMCTLITGRGGLQFWGDGKLPGEVTVTNLPRTGRQIRQSRVFQESQNQCIGSRP